MAKGTSIIVITKEASVAEYCADQQNRSFNINYVQENVVLRRLIQDDATRGEDYHKARLLFHDSDNACYSCHLLGRENEVSTLKRQIEKPGVVSVWGHPGVGKSVIVKKVYYGEMQRKIFSRDESDFTDFSWVDVPKRPFDLIDFSWHLLLGFYSRDVKAKEHAGLAMLRRQNPIQDCCRILRQKKSLVVIDGLRSERDWDKIKATFLSSEPDTLKGCIVVITDKPRAARHCVLDGEESRVLHVQPLRALHRPLTKAPPGRPTYGRRQEAPGWAAEFDLVGRDEENGKLFIALFMHSCVFSLWGVAGVGKSALVRDVYRKYHKDVRSNRSRKHCWVDVPDPFDLSEFSRRLLLGFHSDDLQAKENAAVSIMEGHDTVHMSCKIMRENECLLVIDGLRSTQDWDLIRDTFFSGTIKGHRIVVITNEESIAMHCVHDKRNVLNVKGLNATDSLRLFRKIAWCGKVQLTRDEKEFSKPIVAKCGGLPEVIASVGEYIREKLEIMDMFDETLRSVSLELHRDFMGKLDNNSRFQSLGGLLSWMQSYFDACPDSLKPCIFYLSVFPIGHNIRRRRLLRRWIAEGYSTDTSTGITAEEYGEMLFAELVKSSIIQQQQQTPSSSSNKKKKIVVEVNGFYHGYINSRPMEDNLVFALELHCSINSQRAGQHLTIRSNWDRDKVVYQSIDFTKLRSLTVFGKWMPFFISTDINMRLLRVLDLEDTTSGVTDDVLQQIGKLLPRLKFLSLRGCKEITRIPDSFGGLRQLQTLDVRNTRIFTLPHIIIKLVKLQYLRAGTTHEQLDEGDHAGLAASDEDDCTSTSPAFDEEDCKSTSSEDSPVSIEYGDDTVAGVANETGTSQLAAANSNGTSRSLPGIAEGDDTSTSQPEVVPTDSDETRELAPAAHSVGINQPPAASECDDTRRTNQEEEATTEGDGLSATLPEADGDGPSTNQLTENEHRTSTTPVPRRSKAHGLVVSCSRLCKKLHQRRSDDNHNGVKVPAAGIGKLIALHTLGVVNVNGAGGKAILKEIKKLTQLRKLGVSGISQKNWHELCSVISGHVHLESLSVWLDEHQEEASVFAPSFGDISEPPETLKSLKLYGDIYVSPVLIKQLRNLIKVHLELTISTQEDIDSLVVLPNRDMFCHFHVKAIRDAELRYGCWRAGWYGEYFDKASVLKIDCSSYRLAIVFGPHIPSFVEVLVVHCSTTEASLEVSGLDKLRMLKEVWLKGSYSDAVKQHLQQKLDEHDKKPVLKLEVQASSS